MSFAMRDVCKSFGGRDVLKGLSFEVGPDSITALIGPNGAGKTTVFNLLTGFFRQDSGEIVIDEQPVARVRPQRAVRYGLIRSFQNTRVFDGMTVLENVALASQNQVGEHWSASLFTWPFLASAERRVRAWSRECLEIVGLRGLETVPVENLSQPERKLVNLAQLLASRAEYLLLDEPAAGLDSQSVRLMSEVIRGLAGSGRSVVVVEHNMQFVKSLDCRVLFLHDGRLLSEGTFEEVTEVPELSQIYFGGGVRHR